MRNVDKWRLAMIARAMEKNQPLGEVVAEFRPMINEPPRTITREEAAALAKHFPYTAATIYEAFSWEDE